MENLFAYESDDSGAEPSTSPAQPPLKETTRCRPLGTKSRGSRWAQSSAFLAPVTYDKEDVIDGREDGEDDDECEGFGHDEPERRERTGRLARVSAGGGRPDVARLKSLLPAPTHETCDRNAPGSSRSGQHRSSPAVDKSAADPALSSRALDIRPVISNKTKPTNATGTVGQSLPGPRSVVRAIDAAPSVGKQAGDPVFASHQAPMAHGPPTVPLPAGVVIKEISAGDLRGPPGRSVASSEELGLKLSASTTRNSTVSKLAKRKNQLSALLSEAEATAEEHREKRADGASLRSATRMKYGWR